MQQSQVHWNELSAHITPFNIDLLPYLQQYGLGSYSPQSGLVVGGEIARQSSMLAFNELFWFIGLVTLAIIPLLFFMSRPAKVSLVPAA